jgi:hypothetical protein
MPRTVVVTLAIALSLGSAACGSTRAAEVPDVTGQRLDVAEDALDAAGLRYGTVGGGIFGIVVRSNWVVCRQLPAPRRVATSVTLYVARACDTPAVVGMRLDEAEDVLERAGLQIDAHSLDGGPVVVRYFWVVCYQSPQAVAPGGTVDVYVSHDCWYSTE